MPHLTPAPINPEAIQAEAQKAAWIYSDINAACPYPFGSLAAQIFRDAFEKALQVMSYGQTGEAA